MVHIYFYANTSTLKEVRSIDFEFEAQDLRKSIQCVLSYNKQVINTIIGYPRLKETNDPDCYFSVIVDKDSYADWFDLFADAVVCMLKYSLSVRVPLFDHDVIIG